MAVKKVLDAFANKLASSLNTAVADTPISLQILTGVPLYERMGVILHRVEYQPATASIALLVADGDYMIVELSLHEQPESGIGSPEIIDEARWQIKGTMANLQWNPADTHVIHDFTALPGGGILLPAVPMYIRFLTSSLDAVATIDFRIFFTYKELSPSDYFDLIEAVRGLSP